MERDGRGADEIGCKRLESYGWEERGARMGERRYRAVWRNFREYGEERGQQRNAPTDAMFGRGDERGERREENAPIDAMFGRGERREERTLRKFSGEERERVVVERMCEKKKNENSNRTGTHSQTVGKHLDQ